MSTPTTSIAFKRISRLRADRRRPSRSSDAAVLVRHASGGEVTDEEKRALARVAMMREYPDNCGTPFPAWLGELAALGPVPEGAYDQLMHDGLIVWSDGWRLNAAGWAALEAEAPRPEAEPEEQCADCGEVIVGAHGHCPGVPGGFSDDE